MKNPRSGVIFLGGFAPGLCDGKMNGEFFDDPSQQRTGDVTYAISHTIRFHECIPIWNGPSAFDQAGMRLWHLLSIGQFNRVLIVRENGGRAGHHSDHQCFGVHRLRTDHNDWPSLGDLAMQRFAVIV